VVAKVVVSVVIDKCSIECVGEVRGHDASGGGGSRVQTRETRLREKELIVQRSFLSSLYH
jgi:hypothetical protein